LRVVFSGTRSQIADFNCHLIGHGVRVMELKEEEVDLESVYLSVTGRNRADGVSSGETARVEG
jgi:hypothetical protein